MLPRLALLLVLVAVPGCGSSDEEPAEVRTCYDGSYEPLGAGTVTTEAPC